MTLLSRSHFAPLVPRTGSASSDQVWPWSGSRAQDWIDFVGPGLVVEWIACPHSMSYHHYRFTKVPRTGLTSSDQVWPWSGSSPLSSLTVFFRALPCSSFAWQVGHEKALPLRDRARSPSAQDWTRTSTAFRPHAPQACVSTNFTTWARGRKYRSVPHSGKRYSFLRAEVHVLPSEMMRTA